MCAILVSPEEKPSRFSKCIFEDWLYIDGVDALRAPFLEKMRQCPRAVGNILWAGSCYDCRCSHVGLWISPRMAVWMLFDACHCTSEADTNRGGMRILSQFGFLYYYY